MPELFGTAHCWLTVPGRRHRNPPPKHRTRRKAPRFNLFMQAKPKTRTKMVYIRVTDQEHTAFTKEAHTRGLKLGTWIRAVLLKKLEMETKV